MKRGDADHGKKSRKAPAPSAGRVQAAAESVKPGAFLALSTRPAGSGLTQAIARSAVGEMLRPVAQARAIAATVAAVGPILQLGVSGLDIHEPLHRLEADAQPPALDGGVRSVNRIGELLGSLSMRWVLAPDDFVATPGGEPPATGFQSGASQRFVMQDGVINFLDRAQSAIRFFGAGRTYPATTDGEQRLMLVGTATVVEGVGAVKGVRGTLLISGEITTTSSVSLSVIARFDAGGPVPIEDAIGPLLGEYAGGLPSTMLTMIGHSSGGGDEQLRSVRFGNDLATASWLRSTARVGAGVGTARGPLEYDPTDVRCSVALAEARRVVTFADAAGRRVASITVADLEGTASTEVHDGVTVRRLSGYGPASSGTGALHGAGGVLLFDSATDEHGSTTTVYALRLSDPAGRFRTASLEPAIVEAPAAAVRAPEPSPLESLTFADGRAGLLTTADKDIVRLAGPTLAAGADLLRWWQQRDRAGDYPERFEVVREYAEGDRTFGFFDTATVAGTRLPVMGVVQEMFYDRQKVASAEAIRDQMREFVLRYFMRVSQFRAPEAVADRTADRFGMERAMSWLPDPQEHRVGFGYQQVYYKLRESGRIGKFAASERDAVVDLREIGTVYDWIVLKVDIHDFYLSFAPFGADALRMQLPLKESTYLVLGPPFVKNADNPSPGVLAEYGFGYGFIPYALPDAPPLIAYGPGHFASAIKSVTFRVMHDGEVRVRAAFVVNRPDRIASLDVDPVDWSMRAADMVTFGAASKVMGPVKAVADRLPLRVSGIDPISTYIKMANALTAGMAARRFGISMTVLEKRMLVQHFMQHHEMFMTSLLAWRRVPDWTDRQNLPAYCREGVAC